MKYEVDIIIPVFNNLDYTKKCIESVKNTNIKYQLIVIDNGSDNDTQEYLKTTQAKVIRNDKNLGFVKAINQGLSTSEAAYVILLNNDVILGKNWLENLIDASIAGFDIVVPLCFNSVISVSSLKKDVESKGVAWPDYPDTDVTRWAEFFQQIYYKTILILSKTNFVTFFCVLLTNNVIKQVGLLDEQFGSGLYDDLDYCRRAEKLGFKMAVALDTYAYHKERTTFRQVYSEQELNALLNKNLALLNKKHPNY